MLRNLRAEMVNTAVKPADIASLLDIHDTTVIDKLEGRHIFSFGQALEIKNEYFPDQDIEYLFLKTGRRPSNHD